MARIKLTEGFGLIPEGTHVLQITEVNYDPDFGKVEIIMRTAAGQKQKERFSLLKSNGEVNEKAMNVFSYFAKVALNDFSASDIDPQDLVGHFIRCEVEHEVVESTKDPNKTFTFARLGKKEPCSGFDEEPAAKTSLQESTAPTGSHAAKYNLDDILGKN